ncbi:sensor domain-containing diguanylate cyclase [Microvirga sp. ACRRW]|uniref:sensor domain-containing diguanylate cyclase n=1 Tax=Microvirga sp. ACRRW TaxID=2918205 RepID=UPI001EF63743|nr:sensor domain-containing diguanylate cyclase [Microvirga sp. ACRRW]MCG7392280.1 sensor domain-containing diguanylate cyclase [Microvirga sp. ACRRW]
MHSSPRKTYSSSRWLKIFVALICLIILGLEGWRDWTERQDEFTRIEGEMRNLAKSLTQHAEDTFNLADAILVDIVDRIERQGTSPQDMAGMQAFFSERIQTLQALKTLTVFSENGFVLSSSLPGHTTVNAQHYTFFRHHAASLDRKWFFGPLIHDPIGGDRVLTLSRRLNKPDGSFGGVVQISIPPRYFANFFSRIDVGSEGSIVMISTADGKILSRYPFIERAIGLKPDASEWLLTGSPYGSGAYVSPIDGVLRLAGYQRNHVYPVVLLSSVSQQEALRSWMVEFQIRSLRVAVLVVLIIVLGWRLARELRRREQAEAELAVLATTDGLTGLANRRTFDSRLETEWLRASRDATPLSLFLIDVDQFKAYNDLYGHQQGDDCLRKVAKVIAEAMRRPSDFVARYGGEEIVVVLPDTNDEDAAKVAEAIRAGVEALAVQHQANPPSHILTISIGSVTQSPAFNRSHTGPADLIHMADKALYRAKQGGRNRVAIAQAA